MATTVLESEHATSCDVSLKRFETLLRESASRWFADVKHDSATFELIRSISRDKSQLFEFAIRSPTAEHRVICKVPFAATVAADGELHEEDRPRLFPQSERRHSGLREFHGLTSIQKHFELLNDERFGTIRVLDFVESPFAVVMEKCGDASLKSRLKRCTRFHQSAAAELLEPAFENAGAWLREFHTLPHEEHTQECHSERDSFVEAAQRFVASLAEKCGDRGFFEAVGDKLCREAVRTLPKQLPLVVVHGDFAPRNILANKAGRVTVLDTQRYWIAPAYVDMAYFLMSLKTPGPQVRTQGLIYSQKQLRRWEERILRGCFQEQNIPKESVRLYECLLLLEWWAASNCRFRTASFAKRSGLLLSNHYLRGYVSKLLDEFAVSEERCFVKVGQPTESRQFANSQHVKQPTTPSRIGRNSANADRFAIVAGLTLNGATVMRQLGKLGYVVLGLSYNKQEPGWNVRYGKKMLTPNPQTHHAEWVDFLLEISSDFERSPAFLPMSDVHVIAADKAAPTIGAVYRLHGMGSGLRTSLTSKQQTFQLAAEHGLPAPNSQFINNRDELAEFCDQQAAHVLIKPDLTPQWRSGPAAVVAGERKVIMSSKKDELLRAYDEIAPYTAGVLAQEVIPGPDENLIYWCGFVGSDGRVGGRLVGRKRRIVPIHFGSATFVELVDRLDVEDQCEQFLASVGYAGLCGIELKIDSRDNVAKLIEVNPRYSLWEDIGIPVGINLAREAVDSLYGDAAASARPRHFRQKWVELCRDFPAFLRYRQEGLLSFSGWLKSLAPPIRINDQPWLDDPGYAWHMLLRGIRKRISMRNSGNSPARQERSEEASAVR